MAYDKDHRPADGDDRIDAQLRKAAAALPERETTTDLHQRVIAKLGRRRFTIRATCAICLFGLAAAWAILVSNDTSRPSVAGNHQQTVEHNGSEEPASAAADDVELFAAAYRGLPSPVVELETIKSESDALLSYLDSLDPQEDQ